MYVKLVFGDTPKRLCCSFFLASSIPFVLAIILYSVVVWSLSHLVLLNLPPPPPLPCTTHTHTYSIYTLWIWLYQQHMIWHCLCNNDKFNSNSLPLRFHSHQSMKVSSTRQVNKQKQKFSVNMLFDMRWKSHMSITTYYNTDKKNSKKKCSQPYSCEAKLFSIFVFTVRSTCKSIVFGVGGRAEDQHESFTQCVNWNSWYYILQIISFINKCLCMAIWWVGKSSHIHSSTLSIFLVKKRTANVSDDIRFFSERGYNFSHYR